MRCVATLSLLIAIMVTIKATPLNEEELKKVFKGFPSYSIDPVTGIESISSDDLQDLLEIGGIPHSPYQEQIYKNFWDIFYNGQIPWERCAAVYLATDNDADFGRELAITVDKNNNGFIDKHELALCIEVVKAHNPGLNVTYDDVLEHADINKDGKIDIQHMEARIRNQLQN